MFQVLLFTAGKPFVSSTGLQVSDLMVDLFIASFRINYRNNQHFEVGFQPETDPTLQIAVIKGLYQIVKEVRSWPACNCMFKVIKTLEQDVKCIQS